VDIAEILAWAESRPFGLDDLEERAAQRYRMGSSLPLLRRGQVRCCIRDCECWIQCRTRSTFRNDAVFCPRHELSMSLSPTFIYRNHIQNFLIGQKLVDRVQKVERWRLGNENSEDALTWNVFLGLARLGGLKSLFRLLTGTEAESEPELFLWGNRLWPEVSSWERLFEVRQQLESRRGIPTEPDAALRVPGQAVVLVEAKFGSPNGTFDKKGRTTRELEAFLSTYRARIENVDPLKRDWILNQEPRDVLEQLIRNIIFAQWLAGQNEKPFVANLVRDIDAGNVEQVLGPHLNSGVVEFRRVTWEEIFRLPEIHTPEGLILKQYLRQKTRNLAAAFSLTDP